VCEEVKSGTCDYRQVGAKCYRGLRNDRWRFNVNKLLV